MPPGGMAQQRGDDSMRESSETYGKSSANALLRSSGREGMTTPGSKKASLTFLCRAANAAHAYLIRHDYPAQAIRTRRRQHGAFLLPRLCSPFFTSSPRRMTLRLS